METTFVKGLRVIEALARGPQFSGVSAVAEQLGITRSNAHRLLQTLVSQGYAVTRDGQYALTLRVWELGAAVVAKLSVKSVAPEFLQELSALSGETVHLSVLDGVEVVYIDKVDGQHPIRAYSTVGGRAPAYAVATGKALLAHADATLINAVASNLIPHTAVTLVSPEELKKELERIRKQGFAVNHGEWRDGVCGIGAPIRDASNRVIAAIGISGPAERFKTKNVRAFSQWVCDVAAKISARLGCRHRLVPGRSLTLGRSAGRGRPL